MQIRTKDSVIDFVKKGIPFIGLIVIFLLFSLTTHGKFTTPFNLSILLVQAVIVMVAGVGVTFVMAHGNLDFSIGGELAICSVAAYFASEVNPLLALPAGILAGIICGCLNAWIHNVMGVPAFIAGMCIMFIGRGVARAGAMATSMNTPIVLSRLDTTWFYLVVVAVVFGVGYVLFTFTKIGKYNKAIGSNMKAALLSGVPVAKYKTIAFIISGTCIGICALLTMVKNGGVSANTGQGLEVTTLIALVLGGVSLNGGTSVKMRSCIIGALIFFMLSNGLSLWGINPNLIDIIKGIVFLLCVTVSFVRSNNSAPV